MNANGPAIWGGCVTWRSHPVPGPGALAEKALPVARQVWRAFCRPGANFIAFWRGRGTSLIDGRVFLPVDNAGKGHWRSIAVQVISEAENCHGAECLLRAAVRIRVPG